MKFRTKVKQNEPFTTSSILLYKEFGLINETNMKLSGQAKQNTSLRQWGPVLSSTKKKTEVTGTLTRQNAE